MPQAARRDSELLLFVLIVGGVLYGLLAYFLIPLTWRHYEHQKGLAGLTMVTRTGADIPGDPINVGAVGSKEDLLCAMNAAQWFPADPVTLRSSMRIAGSVLFDRPYRQAPVSPLYYEGRREDLAFEKPAGTSADRRHHVRSWKVLDHGEEGRAFWLGAVTFDRGVGFSHDDGRITRPRRSSSAFTRSRELDRPSTAATAAAISITPTARSKFPSWWRAAGNALRPRPSSPIRRWSI
jgi:hypothetical protein